MQQFEICKRRHAAEVQEIETYVEEIKSLSDEREALTLEFEQENDLIKHEVAQGEIDMSNVCEVFIKLKALEDLCLLLNGASLLLQLSHKPSLSS